MQVGGPSGSIGGADECLESASDFTVEQGVERGVCGKLKVPPATRCRVPRAGRYERRPARRTGRVLYEMARRYERYEKQK